jgi:capsular polysaccharide biosynthesis protein
VQDILAARQGDTSTAAEEAPSLIQAVWRERWVVLACVLIAGLAGVLLSSLQGSKYTAESRIFITASSAFDPSQTNQTGDAARYVALQTAYMDSSEILNAVIKDLGLNVPAAVLRNDVKITTATDAGVVTIDASASDAATAKKIADGIPAAYRAYVKKQVDDRVAQAVAQSRGSTIQAASITSAAAVYGDGVSGVETADLPGAPSSPQPVRNALILALVGLIAGTGYSLYTQSWSRRRVGPVEASAIFGAPVLSEVPDRGRITSEDAIAAAYSEPGDAYRMAAVGLDYIRGTAPGVFLVTAPHDGSGSSLTALNLAAAAADHGRRVFLLNIEDTVRPQSEADAGVLRVPLHDLAQGRIDLGHAVERKAASRAQFGIIRLQVLQPVQGHPVPDVQSILDQLPDDTDLVLLDAPPLPASSASFVLAGQVDAAVVVIDEATTPADLEELQRRCRLAGIPVAGVLVNHIHRSNTAGRRRRAAMSSSPARMYDSSPRGLPILTGGSNVGNGRLHHPDSGGMVFPQSQEARGGRSANYGVDPDPTYVGQPGMLGQPDAAAGAAPGGFNQQQPPFPEATQVGRPAADLPWSAVTRVTPGWEQEDSGGGDRDNGGGGRNRSRR